MRHNSIRFGLCSLALLATAALGLALGQTAEDSDKGERIMNNSCLSCHDLRPIQTQALDEDAWTGKIRSMIEKGAEVKTEDVPVLADFLMRNNGPLPDGAGKTILLNKCTLCHSLLRVKLRSLDARGWDEILSQMLNEGATLSDQEFSTLITYLASNFGR